MLTTLNYAMFYEHFNENAGKLSHAQWVKQTKILSHLKFQASCKKK